MLSISWASRRSPTRQPDEISESDSSASGQRAALYVFVRRAPGEDGDSAARGHGKKIFGLDRDVYLMGQASSHPR